MIKREPAPNGRRHGLRAKALSAPARKSFVRFESRAQVYCWSTDRGLRPVIKH